jgi:malate/lactate dehydrogenase
MGVRAQLAWPQNGRPRQQVIGPFEVLDGPRMTASIARESRQSARDMRTPGASIP